MMMPNINKRYLGIGILIVVIAFYAGIKIERYQQQNTSINVDLMADTSRTTIYDELEPVRIQVYVHGEVQRPGVYYLSEDARVHEAIDEAGGLLPTAFSRNLNLASRLRDGETLYIPSLEEADSQSYAGSGNNANQAGSRININTATIEELQRLPGIGPSLAQRIVDHRTRNGHFRRIEDVKNVSGIGDRRFEDIKDQIDV